VNGKSRKKSSLALARLEYHSLSIKTETDHTISHCTQTQSPMAQHHISLK
jgi:hypothetical protein